MSKNDMARYIIWALHNTDQLPPPSNPNVLSRAKLKRYVLVEQYAMAIRALESVGIRGLRKEVAPS